MNKQTTLSALTDELAQASTSKREFLSRIDRIIPWSEWTGIIKPHNYKGERGKKPFDLELMLRIYLVKNLYTLSDMATMTEVIDARFCVLLDDEGVLRNGIYDCYFNLRFYRGELSGAPRLLGYVSNIVMQTDEWNPDQDADICGFVEAETRLETAKSRQ